MARDKSLNFPASTGNSGGKKAERSNDLTTNVIDVPPPCVNTDFRSDSRWTAASLSLLITFASLGSGFFFFSCFPPVYRKGREMNLK